MIKAWLKPNWRIGIFLALVNLAWMTAAWMLFERETWLWIIPVALSINCVLLTYDQFLQFRSLVGHPLVGSDAWGLLKTVNDLSKELNVAPPKVFLIPRHSAQIFTYAKTRRHARLLITQGMLELLTPRQLRAVLIFQLIAIRRSYNVLNYWVAALFDVCFRLGKLVERGFSFVVGWNPPIAAWFLNPCLTLAGFFLLGSRDFRALDRETAQTLDNPEDLAQALWKMEAYAQTRPWNEPWVFAHMCMVSPMSLTQGPRMMRIQPALKSRIKGLTGRYPL